MPLSNATQQLLSTTPYFDDYYQANTATGLPNGVEFDFHRVLFRPRYGVQSRELTQMQTLLHAQLERLGSAQFRNGDRVIGGGLTIDLGAVSGQVLANTTLTNFFDRDTNEGKIIYSQANPTTKAKVVQYMGVDDGETSNNYLIFKYQSSDAFSASEVVQDRANSSYTATFSSGTPFNTASTISIDEGVCFVSGFFVRIRPQTIVLDPLFNQPSYRVGLNVEEQILDELDDTVGESLGDPANQGAPGAHRFRVRLTLSKRTLDTDADDNFIELCRVIDGSIQANKVSGKLVTMRELQDILARRTYDESGDYVIRPFAAVLEGSPTANSTNSAEETDFYLSLGAGKAYVRGYEIETTEPTRIPINKSRTTVEVADSNLSAAVGNYILTTRLSAGAPQNFFGNTGTVELHCAPIADIDVTSNATYAYSKVGTARVRMLEVDDVPDDITGYANTAQYVGASTYKLYFFDAQFDQVSGNVANATLNVTTLKTTLHVDVPFNGRPNVADAFVGVSIALEGTAAGVYTIEDASFHTTHMDLVIKEYLTTIPANDTPFRLLFQMRDVDSVAYFSGGALAASPYKANLSFQCDVAPAGKTNGAPDGYTKIFNPNDNTLVYQFPEVFIVPGSLMADAAEFTTWLASDSVATSTGAANADVTLPFSTLSSYLNLPIGTEISAAVASENFVVFDVTADANGYGRIIHFSDAANTTSRCIDTVTVTDTDLSFTYRHGATISSARTLIAMGKGDMVGVPARTKDYYAGNTSAVLSGTTGALYAGQVEYYALNTAPGFVYSLKTPDVVSLRMVLYKSSNTAFANSDLSTATVVTDYFTLDDGQRDNTYEYARVITKRGASSLISPEGRLLFIFDWFNQSGVGYATIDSYLSALNVDEGFTYEDIPSFTSPKSGRLISLRNVLDFRPARSNKEFLTSTMVMASSNTSSNTTYLTNEASPRPYLVPVSDRNWEGSYDYYLSRIDRLALFPDGTFRVREGQPAIRPEAPAIDQDALLLYELSVPAYTLVDDDGVPTKVKIRPYDHKRYTMKDLVKIENRVSKLEYYTALSQLERSARDQSILDVDNQERFKNGIVVDGFSGAEVAEIARGRDERGTPIPNPDFTASLDTRNHVLHTAFEYAGDVSSGEDVTPQFNFSRDVANSTTSGVTIIGDMAVPSYVTSAFITQPLATHAVSVNPFSVATYNGHVTLNPTVDTGKSLRPAQVLDMGGPSQAWLDANVPSYTNWGEWTSTWVGEPFATRGRAQVIQPPDWDEADHAVGSTLIQAYQDILREAMNVRAGTEFSYQSVENTMSVGNLIVESYVIHNIRKRDVVFASSGLKPNTAIFPFFDGKSVKSYVQQANALRLAAVAKGVAPSFQMGDTIFVKKALTGTVAVSSGTTALTGTSSVFGYELTAGQLVQVVKGTDSYVRAVSSITSNTAAVLRDAAPGYSVAEATLYTLTPVTVADVTERSYTANGAEFTQITLKVVRAERDADIDDVVPYNIQAGGMSPVVMVNDGADSTLGAYILADQRVWRTNSFGGYQSVSLLPGSSTFAALEIESATIRSGVVRAYDSSAHTVRLDVDTAATANTDIPVGTTVHFVNGAAAGQSANVTAYNAATQTVTLDAGVTLTNITVGSTIYSIGSLMSDGFLPTGSNVSGGYDVATLSAEVSTGYAGTCAGALHLPENMFPVGNRLFRLIDSASNNAADATTRAEGMYSASGLVQVEQPTSITTREVIRTSKSVTQNSATWFELVDSIPIGDAEPVDPVAQSFYVDAKAYPQGVFISSVDLAFETKPNVGDEVDVTVELRPLVNGYPSSTEIVPCVSGSGKAMATLRPVEVKTAAIPSFTDATTYTRFTFPALVHLQPGKEYAIIVRSNSDEYKVFTAQVSQTVLGTSNIVGSQPYAGSFFKSQNASTWSAEQTEDMMFRLNRAEWTVNQTARLVLRAVPFTSNASYDSITLYPHDVNFGNLTSITYELRMFPMNAETEDLTGQLPNTYTVFPNQAYGLPVRHLAQGSSANGASTNLYSPMLAVDTAAYAAGASANTIDLTASFTTRHTDIAPFIDLKKLNALGIRHIINDMPLREEQFEIVVSGDGYANTAALTGTVTTSSGSQVVTGNTTAFNTTLIVGRDVVIGGNLVLTVQSIESDTQFTSTVVAPASRSANVYATYANVSLTLSGSNAGDDAVGYAVISGISSSNTQGRITSVVLTSNGSGYLTSPTVTIDPSASLGTDAEIVYRGEDWTSGGNGLARYMIKPVTLADGFEARDIKVYLDGYRPFGTNFYVYYRVLSAVDDVNAIKDQSWRLMYQVTPDSTTSIQKDQYREFEFSTVNNTAAVSSEDTTDRFKVFAVKVVMASNNPALVPSVKNFRAIALDN